MKLVIAVISNKDSGNVLSAIANHGFFATKLSTAGQFLSDGHMSVFIGTDDSRVDELFDVMQKNVTKRIVRQHGVESTIEGSLLQKPVDVEEFGGVAFVIDVEEFRKF